MRKNINLLNRSNFSAEQPETFLGKCRDLAGLSRNKLGQALAFVATLIGGGSAVHAIIDKPDESQRKGADVYQMSAEELARPTLHEFVASNEPKKAKALGIDLQFLNYLLPRDTNFDPKAKRHDEPRRGEFNETPLVPESQQPYLWPCDSIKGKEENQTPSFVFEAIKTVNGAFHSKLAEITTRNRKLGVLKAMIDNYEMGKDVLPSLKKKLKRLKKIYKNNLNIIENDLKAWQSLNQEVLQLMSDIKKLVELDARTGKGLRRCTTPQKEIDIGIYIKTAPLPVYKNFDSYAEDGIGLLPFECVEISKKDPSKTSSRIYLAITLLERIVMEHIIVSMERNKAYAIARDRVTGEVGASKKKRRQALENVYKKASSLNKDSLTIWLKIHKIVQDIKARAYDAIRRQTKRAKKIKRCRKPSKPIPILRAKETDALKQAIKTNDADAMEEELIRQIGNGAYKEKGIQTDGAYIAFVVGKDIRDLNRKKKAMGRKILKELGRGKLIFKVLRKPLADGRVSTCVLVKKAESQKAEPQTEDELKLEPQSKVPTRALAMKAKPQSAVEPSSDPAVNQAAAKNDAMGVIRLLIEGLDHKHAGWFEADEVAVKCVIGKNLDEAVDSVKKSIRGVFKEKKIKGEIVIKGSSAKLASGESVVCAQGKIDMKQGSVDKDQKAPENVDSFQSRALVDTVNAYRKQLRLPAIPFSPSLSKVAQNHVRDLAENRPNHGRCNLHSWSDKGKWSDCCYTSNHAKASCMWNKPKELTSYRGNGYEISAGRWGTPMTTETALKMWKSSHRHHAVMINNGRWKSVKWNAIGAAIYNGYAVVWFGKKPDRP